MLSLPAKLTLGEASACARDLKLQIATQSDAVVIQASELLEFDSSALAVLLDCRREAMALGKSFSVSGLPDKLVQLAALYGVTGLLSADAPEQPVQA